MANKTIDRKKANLARSRANQASPKPKAARPAVGKEEASSARLDQASRNATGTEVLEAEELDVEEAAVPDEIEGPEDDSAEPEDEDEDATPRARRAKKRERGLTPTGGQSYAISQTTAVRAPSNPFVRFVLSAYRELRLVTWPSRRDTWNWSLVVIAVCAGIGILLGAIDLGLVNFVNWWLSLAQK